MREIKFGRNCIAHLRDPLIIGEIIEVTCAHGIKYTLMVCIDEDKSTSCRSCVFNTNGGSVCDEALRTSFDEYNRVFSPCNSVLLNDGKEYKHKHCIYYKNLDPILEGL